MPSASQPAPQAGPVELRPRDPCRSDHRSDWGEHATWRWRGHACHWRRLGHDGHPPLVLLHGFGASSGHWRRNASELAAAGWCVFSLDLLGFGASDQPALRFDNRLWARQLESFLREVVGEPAVLVGHSLGGLVALSCGVFFPEGVRAVVAAPLPDPTLVMADPQAPGAAPRRRPWRRRLQRLSVIWLCRLLPLELLVPLLARRPLIALGIQCAYARSVRHDGELRRLIAHPARRPGAVRALRAMSIAMALRPHGATAPVLLRRLGLPLLLIWGGADRLVPLAVAHQCHRLQPELALRVLPGVGHCPHDENPDAFHGALLPWLAELR